MGVGLENTGSSFTGISTVRVMALPCIVHAADGYGEFVAVTFSTGW